MTRTEQVREMKTVAYYSGLNGLEIKSIEYGINDYIVCISGAWGSVKNQRAHRVKINYTKDGNAYFRIHGYRIPLDECIRA